MHVLQILWTALLYMELCFRFQFNYEILVLVLVKMASFFKFFERVIIKSSFFNSQKHYKICSTVYGVMIFWIKNIFSRSAFRLATIFIYFCWKIIAYSGLNRLSKSINKNQRLFVNLAQARKWVDGRRWFILIVEYLWLKSSERFNTWEIIKFYLIDRLFFHSNSIVTSVIFHQGCAM